MCRLDFMGLHYVPPLFLRGLHRTCRLDSMGLHFVPPLLSLRGLHRMCCLVLGLHRTCRFDFVGREHRRCRLYFEFCEHWGRAEVEGREH